MNFTKTAIAALLATGVLSGCDNAPTMSDQSRVDSISNKLALEQMNGDKESAAKIRARLIQADPSVVDVYYTVDEKNQKTLVVARSLDNGEIETWQAPADQIQAMTDKGVQEAKEQPTGGGGSNILTGMLLGYVASNMFSSSSGASSRMSAGDYDRNRSMAASSYAASVSNNSRSRARSFVSSGSGRQSSVGTSRGGSFSSTGARAGGYSSGG